jgi:hypothetical protein
MIGSLSRPEGIDVRATTVVGVFTPRKWASADPCRNLCHGQWPIDRKAGNVVADATSRLRRVAFGNEITHLDVIAERLKAVGKSLRNVELTAILAGKLQTTPNRKTLVTWA